MWGGGVEGVRQGVVGGERAGDMERGRGQGQ